MPSSDKTMLDWSFIHRSFYRFVVEAIPRFCRNFFHFEVNGLEYANKFPEGTPIIFCANHRSHLDALLLGSAVVEPNGGRRRAIGFMASGKAMQGNPIFGLTRFLGAFPVFKENPDIALNYSYKLLKRGLAVFIAPQGKRIPSHPFHDYFNLVSEGKTGIGRLILRLNGKVPIVPAWIHGAAEALPRGKITPRYRNFLSVSFTKPLLFDRYTREEGWKKEDPDFFTTARIIVNEIMTHIRQEMLTQEQYYFRTLERKFGVPMEQITVPTSKKSKFDRILSKMILIHPTQLKKSLEGKSIS